MEVVGRCHAGEGIVLVRERGGKVAVRLLEEVIGLPVPYLSGKGHGVHKHAVGVGAAHVTAAVGHRAHVNLLLPAERAYRDIGGTQEVAGRGDAQFMATGHDIRPDLFAEPDFVANLVFQGCFVRNNAGFVLLAGDLRGKEGLRFLECCAVLVGLLVPGVAKVGIVLFFRRFALQGGGELAQEKVVGVAVKDEVVEVAHQAQLAGRLHQGEPVERTGKVKGLHESLFEGLVFFFAAQLDGRDFFLCPGGHQVHFSVPLLNAGGKGGMGLQYVQKGFFDLPCQRSFREGEDERQVVSGGRRVPDAVQVQAGLLEGELLGLVFPIRFFAALRMTGISRQEDVQDIVLYALQAGGFGKAVHVRLQAEALVQFRSQAQGTQGRQATVIQRVCEAEAANAHALLDDVADLLFQLVERRHVGLRLVLLRFRLGKGLHVHFLVHIQRNGFYLHGNGRHHVRRFLAGDEGVQLLDVDLLGTDDVRSQELAGTGAGLVKGLHRNVFNVREFADDSLYFLELDAEAADFHLAVFSAHEFNFAVFPLADNVSGAVGRGVLRVIVKGILHKDLCGFVRPVEVAQAHLGSGDPEFSRLAFGHLLAVLDDIYLDVFHRPADGDVLFLFFHFFAEHVADGFRGAVAVEQAVVRQREAGHFFAAGVQNFEALAVRIVDGELGGHLGGHEAAGDAVLLKILVQGGQVEPDAIRDNVEGGTADDSAVQVRHKGVEAKAGVGCHAGGMVHAHELAVVAAKGVNVFVAEHAALGRTGGAAGVQQDEQVLRFGRLCLGRAGMQFADVGGFQDGALVLLQDGKEVFVGHQHFCAGVFYHEFQALRRVRRVQREVCAAGFERAQRGQHHIFIPAQHYAYYALGGDRGLYIGGEVVCQLIYLFVG